MLSFCLLCTQLVCWRALQEKWVCSFPPAAKQATLLKTNYFGKPQPELTEFLPWHSTKARSNVRQQKLPYYKHTEKARYLARHGSGWPRTLPSPVFKPLWWGCRLLLLPIPLVAGLALHPKAWGKPTHPFIHPSVRPPTAKPQHGKQGKREGRRDGWMEGLRGGMATSPAHGDGSPVVPPCPAHWQV